jgi:hypothetical protein
MGGSLVGEGDAGVDRILGTRFLRFRGDLQNRVTRFSTAWYSLLLAGMLFVLEFVGPGMLLLREFVNFRVIDADASRF